MSRYRPPRPEPSAYITPEGHAAMQAELKQLWQVQRPEVTRKVAEAAAMGDRSENAEYIYGKKQLREMDGRIRYLAKRLDVIKVVDRAPPEQDKIYFGAWVTVVDSEGTEQRFRLVGPDEFDRQDAYISIDSPMARSLLGKRVGAEVTVNAKQYEVLKIGYEDPA